MRCVSCGFENPEGLKFCEECGTKLRQVCPSCGHEVRPTAKFCGECGVVLTEKETGKRRKGEPEKRSEKSLPLQTLDARRQPLDSSRPEAERRQLTVMFCDLVGSTALSEQLDPEEWRKVVQTYQETCTEVVSRFDGHIAQYLGDGLLIYFGYPSAHEDDAQRAVRAGLEIVAALQKQGPFPPQGFSPSPWKGKGWGEGNLQALIPSHSPHPSPLPRGARGLQVRIGIHTGLVVIGDIGASGRTEQLALGDTPNIAARLQGLAEPNTVVISAATHRLIAGFFDCHDGGPQSLKGVSAPVQVYRVLREGSAQSRLEVEVSTGRLTPLVGRAHEVGLLLERWTAAQAGDGQVVLLNGEPGIGKSRLVQEVKERLLQQGATCLEFRCSPYAQNSAFSPVLTHLQRVLQFERDDAPQSKLAKLQQTLTRYHFPQADTLPLLAALLSLPHPEGVPPLTLSPQKQKQKTQEALVAWLVEEAERAPVYCVWEDLHWADPSTLEFLGFLLDQVPTTHLLVLLTARPEFTPPWSSRTHLTPLTLTRLPHTQAAEMIEKVTGGKPLPAEVQHQIVNKTDGVPLFVEELTKMVLESELLRETDGQYALTGPLPLLAIPTTLHDSLMARLDRLATVKEIAQLGATLGREFSYELLQAVSPVDEMSLQQALAKLVEAEVLYQRGAPPQSRYIFKHALIQDAAYQSLLKSRRQQYHQQIAQALGERFVEITETQPELVAYHYTEAGLVEQAIPYWQQAGQRASTRSAMVEAVHYLTEGIELLKSLPDTPERAQQELSLQTVLGPALITTKGYVAPEVENAYVRAQELCQQMGETPQLFPILQGLSVFHAVRAEYPAAQQLGTQLLGLARRAQDSALLLRAHIALQSPLFWRGEFIAASEHAEQGIALYDQLQQHAQAPQVLGQDPGVTCLTYAALALWPLGYPDQAVKKVREAVTLAQELSHPFSMAYAYFSATVICSLCREVQMTRDRAEAAISLATEHGFTFPLMIGEFAQGWALVRQGQEEQGLRQMRRSLATLQAMGAEMGGQYQRTQLAEAYGIVGQAEEGLAVLSEAFALIPQTGGYAFGAELYRVKGELTLRASAQSPDFRIKEAEACFHQAIELARKQSAKSWELRASVSLAQLWQQQGKTAEAGQMLAEIYGWFTEGFDTKDLQEAKALLEELAK